MLVNTRTGFHIAALTLAASGFLRADAVTPFPSQSDIRLDGREISDGSGLFTDSLSSAQLVAEPDAAERVTTNGGTAIINFTYYFTVNYSLSDLPTELVVSAPQYLDINDAPLNSGAIWGASSQLILTSFDSDLNDYSNVVSSLDCFKTSGTTSTSCPDGFVQYTDSAIRFSVLTNEMSRISMNVDVNFPNGGQAETYVDPYISFDPSFDSTGYSLSFSDGISNIAPSPEPSTEALLGCGLLLVSMARRRRRR